MAQKSKEGDAEEHIRKATIPEALPPSNPVEAEKAKSGEPERISENLVRLDELVSKYEGRYWKTYVHITGLGTFKGGKATRDQLLAFIGGMNPETNLDEWLSDKDEVAAYIRANTVKRRPD